MNFERINSLWPSNPLYSSVNLLVWIFMDLKESESPNSPSYPNCQSHFPLHPLSWRKTASSPHCDESWTTFPRASAKYSLQTWAECQNLPQESQVFLGDWGGSFVGSHLLCMTGIAPCLSLFRVLYLSHFVHPSQRVYEFVLPAWLPFQRKGS